MSDALERIKNRQRPEVPKRDPAMAPTAAQPIENSISRYPDIQISTSSDNANQAIDVSISSNLEIETSRNVDIQISTPPDQRLPPVKQTTLRLDKALSDQLQALCHQEQICREVLIEAMFLEMQKTPELHEMIIAQAQERQRKRTAVANHKRAVSMMQRVSN